MDMGFYQTINTTYGNEAVRKLKEWANTKIKLAKERNKRCFLLKCKHLGITPTHITSTTRPIEDLLIRQGIHGNITMYCNRLGSRLVNIEITASQRSITTLEKRLLTLKTDIITLTNEAVFHNFSGYQTIQYNRIFHKIKNNNINKLNNLQTKFLDKHIKANPNWVKNLTDVVIPSDILGYLALGPKFSIEPIIGKDISINNILADVDCITSLITDTSLKNITTARATNVITNIIHNSKNNKHSFIRSLHNKTSKFIKDNPNIILTRSDKGNVTVIMNKLVYLELSNSLITNSTSYTQLRSDPTLSIQRKCNSLIKTLSDSNQIDDLTRKKLTSYNGVSPKFYALPKIHKPTLSVRPIVASVGAPTEFLASFLTEILTKAYDYENEYYIKDSFQVTELFNGMILPDNYVIASLDVVSLFSNVYLDACLRAIHKNWDRIGTFCNITEDSFMNLISFLFDNTYFSFDNKIYKQTFGTPMGASISPILAAYVMDDLLDTVIPVLSFNLHFIKKYVDDIILAIPKDGTTEILDTINSYDPYIQFTIETENEENTVPFLDTKFIRSNNKITIDWYRKPCSSGRFLNYLSYHKHTVKLNLVKQMKARVLKISDPQFHRQNLNILLKLFTDNSYPPNLLKKILFSTPSLTAITNEPPNSGVNAIPGTIHNHSLNSNNHEVEEPADNCFYTSLPYIKDLTPKLLTIFKSVDLNLKIANRSVLTLNSLHSKLKDKTPLTLRSNVVYSIPCKDCNKSYIGQTSRPLKDRISMHKSDCRLHPERCALAEHAIDADHQMDFDSVKILASHSHHSKRLFLEMACIAQEGDCINRKTDVRHLSEIYSYLLWQERRNHTYIHLSDMTSFD